VAQKDDLQRILEEYNSEKTKEILETGKELLKWLKTK